MDFRLLFLLHTTRGLILEPSDLEVLLAPELDPFSPVTVLAAVRSGEARAYIAQTPDWIEISRKTLALSNHHGIRWCYRGQPDYPEPWLELSTLPTLFSYQGEPCWRTHELLAVVGSRTP